MSKVVILNKTTFHIIACQFHARESDKVQLCPSKSPKQTLATEATSSESWKIISYALKIQWEVNIKIFRSLWISKVIKMELTIAILVLGTHSDFSSTSFFLTTWKVSCLAKHMYIAYQLSKYFRKGWSFHISVPDIWLIT